MAKSETQKTHELILNKRGQKNKDWESESSMKLLNAFMNGSDKNLRDKVLDVLRLEEIDQYVSESLLDNSVKETQKTNKETTLVTNKERNTSFED